MKNNIVKVSLIVLASAAAAGGILGFVKTRVNPPTAVSTINVHQQSIEESTQKFDGLRSVAYNDSLYKTVADRIKLFSSENLIAESERTSDFLRLTDVYVPIFRDNCFKTFSQQGWGSSKFRDYRARIEELKNLPGNLSATSKQQLDALSKLMKDYETARRLVNSCSYSSVSQARQDIKDADSYLADSHIRCSDLQNSLVNFRRTMEQHHYAAVRRAVQSLSGYYGVSESTYDQRQGDVQQLINEYNSNKADLYGNNARDIAQLNSDAANYVAAAKRYFAERRKSVRYSLGYNWRRTSSPSSDYYAFESNTCGSNSSTATMTFTITGYSTFTCYVRSDGERKYDYLTISEATSNYTKWSGYDKGNSSTYFYAYTPITYSNLNPSSYYTITVKYQKDGSGSSYADRGFLLLPNNAQPY